MSRTTEIYTCQPGQDVKQGKLELSGTITTREAAMADAFKRTKADPSIAQIAYFSVGENGDVEPLFSYESKKSPKSAKVSAPRGAKAGPAKGSRKKAAKKKSLFGRLRAVIEV